MAAGATIKHFAVCNGVNVELLNRRFAEQFEADDLLLEAQQLILVACVDQFVNRGCSGGEADAVAALIGARPRVSAMRLGYHLKTGHRLSVQNRPTGLAEDVIVLPCRGVDLQGAV
jgi:hypothetical protein